MKSPSVALVYDRVNSWGGAERVLLALHELYPQAPLYTSVYEPEKAGWAVGWDVRPSWLQRIPWARRRHQLFGWLMPFLFESFDFSEYDVVISVTSEAAKAIITQPNQLHICYLLTPTRYLWSHRKEYLRNVPTSLRPLARKVTEWLRLWDRAVAARPDVIIPISDRVKARAQRYYRRSIAPTLYPPFKKLTLEQAPKIIPSRPFFFSWGRQVAYKRFDQLVRAASEAKVSLVIAGDGPAKAKNQSLATELDPTGQNIVFTGEVSEEHIAWYAKHAIACIFSQEEDFGITIMEAQLAGSPVIVHPKSGASELLTTKTAIFLEGEKHENIVSALKTARRRRWQRLDIRRQAQKNAGAYFRKQWQARLKKMLSEYVAEGSHGK